MQRLSVVQTLEILSFAYVDALREAALLRILGRQDARLNDLLVSASLALGAYADRTPGKHETLIYAPFFLPRDPTIEERLKAVRSLSDALLQHLADSTSVAIVDL